MAGRIRTVKPEFFDSPHTAKASAVVRLAYIGLWCWADDTGRGTCNPKELEGFIFPNDDLSELSHGQFTGFSGILPELAGVFGVVFYEVDGRRFFEIPTWSKHQRVYGGKKSKYPAPSEGNRLYCNDSSEPAESFREVPGTSGSLPPGTGEQGNRGTGDNPPSVPPTRGDDDARPTAKPKRRTTGTRLPEDWTPSPDLIAWTRANAPAAASDREVERFRDYWTAQPGSKGRKTSWDATWRNWARRCQDQHATGYRSQSQVMADIHAQARAQDAARTGDALALIERSQT